MVQEGQPREKIVATLKDLGVNDEQSKRLLLIAEADTFTLLKKEINGLVKSELLSQKKEFEDLIKKEVRALEESEKDEVSVIASAQLKEVKNDIISESKGFEDRINKVINDSQKTVSLVKVALDSLGARIAQMELDVEQMKVHKYRKKSMFFSYAILGLGAVVLCVSLYLLFANFASLDAQQIIVITIMALASISMMFASIIA